MTIKKPLQSSVEEHSTVVGGSSAAQKIGCPGATQQQEHCGIPDEGSSFAAEGSAMHGATEYVIDRDDEFPVEKLMGMSFMAGGQQWVMDDERVDTIGKAVAELDAIIERMIAHAAEAHDRDPATLDVQLYIEMKLPFPGIDGAFGTADVVIFVIDEDDVILLAGGVDWKYGRGVRVKAKNSEQQQFYALCVIDHFDLWDQIDEFVINIVQPRLDHFPTWTATIEQLRIFQKTLIKAVEGPKFLRTGSWCRFCRAAVTCPERQKDIATALAWKALGPELPDPDFLSNLDDWLRAAKSAIYKALEAGGKVDGWKMVRGRKSRKWAVDDRGVVDYLEQAGLEADQHSPRSLITVPAAEKLLKPVKVQKDKIMVQDGKLTMAPEDDSRAGVDTGPRNPNDLAAFLPKKKN